MAGRSFNEVFFDEIDKEEQAALLEELAPAVARAKELRERGFTSPIPGGRPLRSQGSAFTDRLLELQLGPDSDVLHALRIMRDAEETPLVFDPDPGNIGMLASIATSIGIAVATNGLSVGTQIAAQMGGGFVVGTSSRLVAGQDLGSALEGGKIEGLTAGAGESFGLGITKGLPALARTKVGQKVIEKGSGVFRYVRDGFRGRNRVPKPSRLDRLSINAKVAVETAQELGGVITPGRAIEGTLADRVEDVIRNSFVSQAIFKNADLTTRKLAERAFDSALNSIRKFTRREVAEFVQNVVQGRITQVTGAARAAFRAIDEEVARRVGTQAETELLSPQVVVRKAVNKATTKTRTRTIREGPFGEDRRFITRQVTEEVPATELVPGAPTPVVTVTRDVPTKFVDIRALKAKVADIVANEEGTIPIDPRIKALLDMEDFVSFSKAQAIRQDMFLIGSQNARLHGAEVTKAVGQARGLDSLAVKAVDDALKKLDPDLQRLAAEARELWKEEVRGTFTTKLVQKLANDQPDELLDSILSGGSVNEIVAAREFINKADPTGKAFDAVQGAFIRRLAGRNTVRELDAAGNPTGRFILNGKGFRESIDQLAREDGGALQAMFGGSKEKAELLNNMRRYATVVEFIDKNPVSDGSLRMAFQLQQASAIGGLVTAGISTAAAFEITGSPVVAAMTLGAFVITPRVLAELFTNRRIANWLILGVGAPPGTRTAARATIQVIGSMLEDDLIQPEQRSEAEAQVRAAQRSLGIEPGSAITRRAPTKQDEPARVTLTASQLREIRALSKSR